MCQNVLGFVVDATYSAVMLVLMVMKCVILQTMCHIPQVDYQIDELYILKSLLYVMNFKIIYYIGGPLYVLLV